MSRRPGLAGLTVNSAFDSPRHSMPGRILANDYLSVDLCGG